MPSKVRLTDSLGTQIYPVIDPSDKGTKVVANPTLAGTENNLTGIQVGETKYKVPAGGGGGGSEVVINPTLTGNEDNVSGIEVDGTKYKLDYAPTRPSYGDYLDELESGYYFYNVINPNYEDEGGSRPDSLSEIAEYLRSVFEGIDTNLIQHMSGGTENLPFVFQEYYGNSIQFQDQTLRASPEEYYVQTPMSVTINWKPYGAGEVEVRSIIDYYIFTGDIHTEIDVESGDSYMVVDKIVCSGAKLLNPQGMDLDVSNYRTWLRSILEQSYGDYYSSDPLRYILDYIYQEESEYPPFDFEDQYGNKWSMSSPTSENSADLKGKMINIPRLQDKMFYYETSFSVESDAETGDSKVVVGEEYWAEIGRGTTVNELSDFNDCIEEIISSHDEGTEIHIDRDFYFDNADVTSLLDLINNYDPETIKYYFEIDPEDPSHYIDMDIHGRVSYTQWASDTGYHSALTCQFYGLTIDIRTDADTGDSVVVALINNSLTGEEEDFRGTFFGHIKIKYDYIPPD